MLDKNNEGSEWDVGKWKSKSDRAVVCVELSKYRNKRE